MTLAQVDILIPVFNAEFTLEASLQSVASQSFTDFRVILVNDGSSDSSAEILNRWKARDSRFVVVDQANGGIVSALNTALAMANAKYVARMDADDICLPDRLALQFAYLEQHPNCVALGCGVEHIDEFDSPINGLPQPGDPGFADPHWVPVREPYIVHPFLMARTAMVREVGGYRGVPHSEDSDLYWRLREVGTLHNLPVVLGRYRFHTSSISGGSVINGRIMAIGSQLGGLAARRRARGEAEPVFAQNLVGILGKAKTLTAMCAIVEDMLQPHEIKNFYLSVGIKLLELSSYRPYEIEISDCAFIRAALRNRPSMSLLNAREIRWYVSETTARLIRSGKVKAAMALAPVVLWPRCVVKSLWR